jgi:hypothetical protein
MQGLKEILPIASLSLHGIYAQHILARRIITIAGLGLASVCLLFEG